MSTALAIRPNVASAELRIIPAIRADEHPARIYLASLAVSGRRPMQHLLRVAARLVSGGRCDEMTLPWPSLRHSHLQAIRAAVSERYAPATSNLLLSAVKGVLRAAWRLNLIGSDDYLRAVDVKRVKGDSDNDDQRRGRHVTQAELERMFEAVGRDGTAVGRRDAALLAVMFGAGLRRNELATLAMSDLAVADDRIVMKVCGKGNRTRTAYLCNEAVDAMREWLAVRGEDPGPVFLAVKQGGAIQSHGMSGSAIFYRLRLLGRRARIKGRLSPHDARRTFAGNAIDKGVDLSVLQRLMGHASVNTTARYDHRPVAAKISAMMKIRLPFVPQGQG